MASPSAATMTEESEIMERASFSGGQRGDDPMRVTVVYRRVTCPHLPTPLSFCTGSEAEGSWSEEV